MTYKQISEKYALSLRNLYNRVHVLRIEGKFKGKEIDFNKNQVRQIIEYNPIAHFEKRNIDNHPRKITIIEFYIKFGGVNKVSRMLNINKIAVSKAINEFKETGCVTVTSKLNRMEAFEENGNYVNE